MEFQKSERFLQMRGHNRVAIENRLPRRRETIATFLMAKNKTVREIADFFSAARPFSSARTHEDYSNEVYFNSHRFTARLRERFQPGLRLTNDPRTIDNHLSHIFSK